MINGSIDQIHMSDYGSPLRALDADLQYHEYRESPTTISEHPAFDIVVRKIPEIIEDIASDRGRDYKVKGSTGAGFVTAAPWIAVLDRAVTDKPTQGYYVVYLYSVDLQSVYLSLAFGVTAFKELHGGSQRMRNILGNSALRGPRSWTCHHVA